MADLNITEEVFFEMLEKKADGSFKAKYPKVKSKSGVTFDEHLAETASQAHLAKNIGVEDANNNFVATDVEGALQELFTNVSSGKSLVGGAITGVDNSIVIPTDPTFQQLANAIGQISTGKKWASGTFSAKTGSILVNGLKFKPSIVIIECDPPYASGSQRKVYWSSTKNIFTDNLVYGRFNASDNTQQQPNWNILLDGFETSMWSGNLYNNGKWIAIE